MWAYLEWISVALEDGNEQVCDPVDRLRQGIQQGEAALQRGVREGIDHLLLDGLLLVGAQVLFSSYLDANSLLVFSQPSLVIIKHTYIDLWEDFAIFHLCPLPP